MSITYLAMMFYFSAFLSRTQYSPDGLRIHLNPDQDKALAKKMNEWMFITYLPWENRAQDGYTAWTGTPSMMCSHLSPSVPVLSSGSTSTLTLITEYS